MMTKGQSKDIFVPFLWATDKMMEYWKGMAQQDLMMHTHLMEAYAVGVIQGTLQVTKTKCSSLQSESAELTRKGLHKWNYGMFEAALTYLLGEITKKPRLTM